jgi:hypothetical protein
MLSIAQALALAVSALALLSCSRSADSKLIGEWNNSRLDPTARITYSADHTYSAHMEHPRDGKFTGAGTWRIDGSQMICRDYEHGDSKAEILKITQNALQIKGPDGIISTYQRIR